MGICLLTFATWQYTVYPPDCCYGNTSQLLAGDEYDSFTVDWNANCSELHKVTVLNQINLHISPTVVMVLAMAGLIVREVYFTKLWSASILSFVFEHCVCSLPLPSSTPLVTGTPTPFRVCLLLTSSQRSRQVLHEHKRILRDSV